AGRIAAIALTPTAQSPVLIKIEPGTYDLGATTFNGVAFVDVEGSGELTTHITGHAAPVVNMANGTELRELGVLCNASASVGGNGPCSAIDTGPTAPSLITHVTAEVANTTQISIAIRLQGGSSSLTNVTALALGDQAKGIDIEDGFATLRAVDVFAQG